MCSRAPVPRLPCCQATCDRMGARLCAPAELANDVARMTGCDLDDKLVWTTPSFDDATQCRVAAGSSRGVVGDGQPTSTDEDCTARHPVRCCAGGASTFERYIRHLPCPLSSLSSLPMRSRVRQLASNPSRLLRHKIVSFWGFCLQLPCDSRISTVRAWGLPFR
jgi:hypothetical protein